MSQPGSHVFSLSVGSKALWHKVIRCNYDLFQIVTKSMATSDDLWYLTRWLQQVNINSDSDPGQKKRKRSNGLPMAFVDPDSEGELTRIIEEHGGIVVYSYIEAFMEDKIIIRIRDLTKFFTSEDALDKLFIQDSITANNIVNLNEYRLTISARFDEDVEATQAQLVLLALVPVRPAVLGPALRQTQVGDGVDHVVVLHNATNRGLSPF